VSELQLFSFVIG